MSDERFFSVSDEKRMRISLGVRRAQRQGHKKQGWIQRLAPEYQAVARALRRKIPNTQDLRRMVEEHIAVTERRKRSVNGSP